MKFKTNVFLKNPTSPVQFGLDTDMGNVPFSDIRLEDRIAEAGHCPSEGASVLIQLESSKFESTQLFGGLRLNFHELLLTIYSV